MRLLEGLLGGVPAGLFPARPPSYYARLSRRAGRACQASMSAGGGALTGRLGASALQGTVAKGAPAALNALAGEGSPGRAALRSARRCSAAGGKGAARSLSAAGDWSARRRGRPGSRWQRQGGCALRGRRWPALPPPRQLAGFSPLPAVLGALNPAAVHPHVNDGPQARAPLLRLSLLLSSVAERGWRCGRGRKNSQPAPTQNHQLSSCMTHARPMHDSRMQVVALTVLTLLGPVGAGVYLLLRNAYARMEPWIFSGSQAAAAKVGGRRAGGRWAAPCRQPGRPAFLCGASLRATPAICRAVFGARTELQTPAQAGMSHAVTRAMTYAVAHAKQG